MAHNKNDVIGVLERIADQIARLAAAQERHCVAAEAVLRLMQQEVVERADMLQAAREQEAALERLELVREVPRNPDR